MLFYFNAGSILLESFRDKTVKTSRGSYIVAPGIQPVTFCLQLNDKG